MEVPPISYPPGGPVETAALDFFPDKEELLVSWKERTPAKRIARPEEIAAVAAFLLCFGALPFWSVPRLYFPVYYALWLSLADGLAGISRGQRASASVLLPLLLGALFLGTLAQGDLLDPRFAPAAGLACLLGALHLDPVRRRSGERTGYRYRGRS